MKFTVIIEDTYYGVKTNAYMVHNEVPNDVENSLAARLVYNWSNQVSEMKEQGLLVVKHPQDD